MKRDEYDDLPEQTKDKVCEDHGVPLVKALTGEFICPFCEWNEWRESQQSPEQQGYQAAPEEQYD